MRNTSLALALLTLIRPASADEKSDTTQSAAAMVSRVGSASALNMSADPSLGGIRTTMLPDLFTGALTVAAPLALPPGRGSMVPTLSLVYRSDAGNGWVGRGWDLELGAIEVDLRKKNAPKDRFLYKSSAGVVELSEKDGWYWAKVEATFTRFKQVSFDDGTTHWLATDRLGQQYWFGQTAASRTQALTSTIRWSLDRVEDTDGNYLTISYQKPDGRLAYPESMAYAGHALQPPPTLVRFHLEERPLADRSIYYMAGQQFSSGHRLSAIEVSNTTSQGAMERYALYVLQYRQSAATERSLLTTVTQFGKDVDWAPGRAPIGIALPPQVFSYSGQQVPNGGSLLPTRALQGDPGQSASWADIDADGRPDYCRLVAPVKDSTIVCTTWALDGSTQDIRSATDVDRGRVPSIAWVDFNGDGTSDFCRLVGNPQGPEPYIASCVPSTRNLWGDPVVTGPLKDPNPIAPVWLDVNGDGRADFCRLRPTDSNLRELFEAHDEVPFMTPANQEEWLDGAIGNGRVVCTLSTEGLPDIEHMELPGIRFLADDVISPELDLGAWAGWGWTDFDGDGTLDFCRVTDVKLTKVMDSGRERVARVSGARCALFNENGFNDVDVSPGMAIELGDAMGRAWTDVNGDGYGDLCDAARFCYFSNGTTLVKTEVVTDTKPGAWEARTWVDFNGDGLTDYCDIDGGIQPRCRPFTGSAFVDWIIWPARKHDNLWESRWVDVDADGIAEYCQMSRSGNVECMSTGLEPPDLLEGIENGLGGTTLITYKPSSRWPHTRLPFVVQTVDSVSELDGRGQTSTTTLAYEGGYWNTEAREFRGFRKVTQVGPAGRQGERAITETFFHQGNGLAPALDNPKDTPGYMRGKAYLTRVSDERGRILSEIELTYAPDADGVAPYFNPISESVLRTCDGACDFAVVSRHEYDALGNNVVTRELTGAPGSLVAHRTTVRHFTPNLELWILGLADTERLYAGNPAIDLSIGGCPGPGGIQPLACSQQFYDGADDCEHRAPEGPPIRGHLTRSVSWLAGSTNPERRMAYGPRGQLLCLQAPNEATTRFEYDPTGTFLRRTYSPLGLIVETVYFGVDGTQLNEGLYGQVKETRDPNSTPVSYEYDGFGRISKVIDGYGQVTTLSYERLGDPHQQYVILKLPGHLESQTFVDGLGRPYARRRSGPQSQTIRTDTVYDARGLAVRRSAPFIEGVEAPAWTESRYDALIRPYQLVDPNGYTVRSCYSNWTSTTLDQVGHRRRQTYDGFGRLVRVDEYHGQYLECSVAADAPYATTFYHYDERGAIKELVDANGRTTVFSYDTLGRRAFVVEPASGRTEYTYDVSGNLVGEIDGEARRLAWTYDVEGRVTETSASRKGGSSERHASYSYGPSDSQIPYSRGRLLEVRDDLETRTSYDYDALGRVVAVTRVIKGREYRTSYDFDSAGRLASLVFPDGAKVNYKYDGPVLVQVLDDHGREYAAFTNHDGLGRARETRFANGVVERRAYCPEANLRLCSLTATSARGDTLLRADLDYDPEGNVERIRDSHAGDQFFEYDAIGRLASVVADERSASWSYDRVGDISFSSARGDYFYGAAQGQSSLYHLTTVGADTYSYDSSGRELKGPERQIAYDERGSPEEVRNGAWRVRSTFDGQGARLRREVWKGRILRKRVEDTLFLGPEYRCESDSCSRVVTAGGAVIAVEDVQRQSPLFIHFDHLGSIRLVTDQTGNVVRRTDYSPFGLAVKSEGSHLGSVPEVFAGLELEGGLYLAGSRYYDPALGRFLAADFSMPFSSDPQLLNRYSYARNNPLAFADPDGENPVLIAMGVGALLGGLQAGVASNWNLDAVLRGAAIGAVIGGIGGSAGQIANSAIVGGAVGGATSAQLSGGDVGRGAAIGGLTAGLGLWAEDSGLSDSLGTQMTGAAVGGVAAGVAGEPVGEGAVWGFIGALASESLTPKVAEGGALEAPLSGTETPARGAGKAGKASHPVDWEAEYARVVAYDKPIESTWSPLDLLGGGARVKFGQKEVVRLMYKVPFVRQWFHLLHVGRHPYGQVPGSRTHLGYGWKSHNFSKTWKHLPRP